MESVYANISITIQAENGQARVDCSWNTDIPSYVLLTALDNVLRNGLVDEERIILATMLASDKPALTVDGKAK